MADSSGQPAAQRIGALRVNDCRWGRLAQNFSRNPRPVPSYPCTVVVSSVRGKRLTSCRRSGAGIDAASSTISQAAVSCDANSASGAIKRNASPAKLASTSTALRVGAVTMASPPSWRSSMPARADFPRPRSAVTAAIPGGSRNSCSRISACSAWGWPSAGCQSGRGAASGDRGRSDCCQSSTSGSAINCRQQR